MKKRDFEKLAAGIIRLNPELSYGSGVLYLSPVGRILRGFTFEGSSFDRESFYCWAFVLPLYVPAEVLGLNFGVRLRDNGGDRWSSGRPGLTKELAEKAGEWLPTLRRLDDPGVFADEAAVLGDPRDPYFQRAVAYSLVAAGRFEEAEEKLERLASELVRPGAAPWVARIRSQAEALLEKLRSMEERAIIGVLDEWQARTVEKLGLRAIVGGS